MGPSDRTLPHTHTHNSIQIVHSNLGEKEGRRRRTESPVARDEHDPLLIDHTAEPVRADIPLRERGERRDVLDADDDCAGAGAADEVVEDAREVARARADVEYP
jgi:hypothetical protein